MKTLRARNFQGAAAAVLGVLLVTCAPPPRRPREVAPPPNLVLVPFTIEEEPVEGAPASKNDVFAQILASEATSTASRALIERRIGSSVELASRPGASSGAQALRVTGAVRIPLALPAGVEGLRADQRRGPLVVAVVRLMTADGNVIRESTGTLTWSDADWLVGGPNRRRNRPVQTVLQEAVREAVELAIRHLDPSPEHDREDRESQERR